MFVTSTASRRYARIERSLSSPSTTNHSPASSKPRVGAQRDRRPPDEEARMQARAFEHRGDHRRRGGLAVRARHDCRLRPQRDEVRHRVGARPHGDPAASRRDELGIVGAAPRWNGSPLRCRAARSPAHAPRARRRLRGATCRGSASLAHIGTADAVPELQEETRDRAHRGAAHRDDVHPSRTASDPRRLRSSRRVASASAATASAAPGRASVRAADDIASSRPGRARSASTSRATRSAVQSGSASATAAPADANAARSQSGDRPRRRAHGTRIDGIPAAASSATLPPARVIISEARA